MANPLSRRVRTTLFYALRAAFRLTPMPQATRDRLRQRFLDTRGDWVPEGPKGKAPSGAQPRRPYVRSDERAIGYVPYEKGELPDPLPATLVAFYLPQFHTIPENDAWWGKGFTEWRNVTRALPQFEGHYQPKLPGDLGFYDLRNVEVMHEQARLAREYGISAFCFYFYWFGGKTLLETPLRNWLNDKTIDLKFCLCWANEKWTRTWDGRGNEILIDQQHSPEDDIAFIEYVAEYMRDPRYLRVDGRPLLVIYRPGLLPDMLATAERWRNWCLENGVGAIELAYVQSFDNVAPASFGLDSAIEFPPNSSGVPAVTDQLSLLNPAFSGSVKSWRAMADSFMERPSQRYTRYPGINPSWDNQGRRPGSGVAYIGATPYGYGRWLSHALTRCASSDAIQPPIFINAWNEWAEGAVLEPDLRWGHAWLHATRESLRLKEEARKMQRPCVVIHAWYPSILADILERLANVAPRCRLVVTTAHHLEAEVRQVIEHASLTAELHLHENRGRDILPFLKTASRLLLEGEDLVLKLHTKRSPHLSNGDLWRESLLRSLIDDGAYASAISRMRADPIMGMIAPEDSLLPLKARMGGNDRATNDLAIRIGVDISNYDAHFAAGSMFWVRLPSLAPLIESDLVPSEFEAEAGQIDGTTAHAVERLFAAVVRGAGYKVV